MYILCLTIKYIYIYCCKILILVQDTAGKLRSINRKIRRELTRVKGQTASHKVESMNRHLKNLAGDVASARSFNAAQDALSAFRASQ